MDSPDILQNGVDVNNPNAIPAQAQPQAAPQVPVAPAQSAQALPAQQPQAQPAAGSFADKLGAAMQTMSQHPGAPAVLDAPGGFSRMILAAATDALAPSKPLPQPSNGQRIINSVENFFSPLAQFSGAPIAGAGKVAQYDQQQREAQRQQQIQEQQNVSKEQREKLQFAMGLAVSNSQMLHSQFLLHKAGVEELDANAVSGQKQIETLKNQPQPGVVLGENLTSDKLKEGIDNKSFNLSAGTAIQTGKVQDGVDPETGLPRYRATYAWVELPKEVRITDKDEAKALMPSLSDSDLAKIGEGHALVLPGDVYNGRYQAMETQKAIAATAQKASEEASIATGVRAGQLEAQKFADSDGKHIWANDLATVSRQHPNWGMDEVTEGAYRMLQQNPPIDPKTGQPQYPHLAEDVAALHGEKNMDNIFKAAETARHNRAEEANKASELSFKKAENNFINPPGSTGLSGDAYLQMLPQPQRDLLKAINEGREVRSPRQLQDKNGNPTPLALALHTAFPDFDISKTENFAKVRKDFSNPNGTGGQITAFGTVLNHMRNLYDNATGESLIPGTEAHRKMEVDAHNVAVEMANALTTHGKAAEAEIKDQEKALSAWTPAGRREKIREAVRLLDGKLSEREQQWKNAAPSAAYAPPMPSISNEARANAEYVLSGGQTKPTQQQIVQPAQPKVVLPPAPAGKVAVQIPGSPVGFIPQAALNKFKQDHPNAVIGQ